MLRTRARLKRLARFRRAGKKASAQEEMKVISAPILPAPPSRSRPFRYMNISRARQVRSASAAKRNADPRGRILRSAVAEFADKGLAGARVDEIAARARINKRMLYHYFGNKEALYLAVLESVYADLLAAESGLDREHADPVERI